MNLKITVSEHGCLVEQEGQNGDVILKAVDATDLARAFAGDSILDTGWLGPRIHRFAQVGGVTRLLVEAPPTRRTIRYERATVENVPTPRMLFNFGLRNGQLQSARVVVCAEPVPPQMEWIPTDTTPVARVPFPNVFHDTRVCWGRAAIPVLTIETVGVLVNLFFAAPFNHDLETDGLPSLWRGSAPPRGVDLLRRLAAEPRFPMDLLVRCGTLGSWWQGDVNGRW